VSFAIMQSRRIVAHGNASMARGGLGLKHIPGLRRGRYTLVVTIGHGRRARVLSRRTFVVR
jgi:hypothetical protein